MKRFHYILTLLLSLLIVYAGAGVSIIHYCCNRCETVQSCCTGGCEKCNKSHHHESAQSCKEQGCTATFHKVDLVKQAYDFSVSVPAIPLLCEQIPNYRVIPAVTEFEELLFEKPPTSVSSRHYLALYSVFII